MKKTGRPLTPTVNDKAEVVLHDPSKNQQVASYIQALASIRRGLAQARKGVGRLADEVFGELEHQESAR